MRNHFNTAQSRPITMVVRVLLIVGLCFLAVGILVQSYIKYQASQTSFHISSKNPSISIVHTDEQIFINTLNRVGVLHKNGVVADTGAVMQVKHVFVTIVPNDEGSHKMRLEQNGGKVTYSLTYKFEPKTNTVQVSLYIDPEYAKSPNQRNTLASQVARIAIFSLYRTTKNYHAAPSRLQAEADLQNLIDGDKLANALVLNVVD